MNIQRAQDRDNNDLRADQLRMQNRNAYLAELKRQMNEKEQKRTLERDLSLGSDNQRNMDNINYTKVHE